LRVRPCRFSLIPAVSGLLVVGAFAGCGGGASTANVVRRIDQANRVATEAAVHRLGGVELRYRPHAGTQPVTARSLNLTVAIIRRRLQALHLRQFWVGTIGHSANLELVVLAATTSPSTTQQAEAQAGASAQLRVYDWEPNVIGSNGQPEPGEATITGGTEAGAAAYGLTEYQAAVRAAARPALLRSNDTTYQAGCTASANHAPTACRYGQWFLVDSQRQQVLRGPANSEQELYADHYTPSAVAQPRALHIKPGTTLMAAKTIDNAHGQVINPSAPSWYVLNDDPALTNTDITNVALDAARTPPTMSLDFSATARGTLQRLTAAIAQRGARAQLPGVPAASAAQHLAVVVDDQLIATPAINRPLKAGANLQLTSGFTPTTGQNLVNELRFGALPLELELIAAQRTPSLSAAAPLAATPTTDQSAPNPKSKPAFSIIGKTEHGDTIHVEGRFGPILAPNESDVDQTALSSCPDTDGRELVRRLDVTAIITSALPGYVRVGGFVVQVDEENQHGHLILDYVLNGADGSHCYRDTSEGGGVENLGTLQPHVPRTFSMWVVLPDAITPNDPHPTASTLAHEEWYIGYPAVSVNGALVSGGGGGTLSVTE
jgi:hypothetical protein